MPSRVAALRALALASWMPLVAHGQASDPRAAVLLRAVAYERSLANSPDALRLAVLMGHGATAAADSEAMAVAFTELSASAKVAGRRLVVDRLNAGSDEKLALDLQRSRPHIVYLPQHAGPLLASLTALLRGTATLVVCGDVSAVGRGCLLAMEQEGGHARVVIDLAQAQRLGLHFDGRLLQLARVVTSP